MTKNGYIKVNINNEGSLPVNGYVYIEVQPGPINR